MHNKATATAKTPLILVNGHLGSGKTTFLKRLISHSTLRNSAIIENEIATKSYDSESLESHQNSNKILTISGECICCSDPEQLIKMILELRTEDQARPIIIESTGAAQAAKLLVRLLTNSLFEDNLYIASTIYVIDAFNLNKNTYNYGDADIASVVVVTKTDLERVATDTLGFYDANTLRIDTFVDALWTETNTYQKAIYSALADADLHDVHAPYAHVSQPSILRELHEHAITSKMVKFGVDRIKGFVSYANKYYIVDGTRDHIRIEKLTMKPDSTYVVSIGSDKKLIQEFAAWLCI